MTLQTKTIKMEISTIGLLEKNQVKVVDILNKVLAMNLFYPQKPGIIIGMSLVQISVNYTSFLMNSMDNSMILLIRLLNEAEHWVESRLLQ